MLDMDLAAMRTLDAECVTHLVVHTTGTPNGEDTTAAAVNDYHRRKLGWSGIGYHFLVRFDGTVEPGRPLVKQGAHVAGLNACSIGIAFSGNGDLYPLTPAQLEAGLALGERLVREYGIRLENVIGHREVNNLIEKGLVPTKYRTPKSCPGVRVNMNKIRFALADRLFPPPEPSVVELPEAA